MRAFTRFAWSVLVVNLAVVAWGAFVRATGSGAGCGRHWPTCNGAIVPRAPGIETVIEFAHRASSGVALLLVVALAIWALRAFPRPNPARPAAVTALALMIVEALLGAGLVLFGWVAKDASAARGWVMALHLVTTFLLLGALALAAEWSARPGGLAITTRPAAALAFAAAVGAVLLAGVSGAVAALGDTLYPATSFAAGLRDELDGTAHLLLRLRIVHPFVATAAGAALLAVARLAIRVRPDGRVRQLAVALVALVAIQTAVGAVNVLLLAPVFLQIVHLVLADLLWLALVLLSAATLAPGEAPERRGAAVPATA
jgi:cytochrome c oxidase assembly protein subunit 15